MINILVVDDQLVMRNMFKNILEPEGYNITLAEDGSIAYNKAMSNKYDIVLSDLYMPKLNGIELTKKLRDSKQYRGIPILIVSTEGAQEKKMEGKAAGASGWIVKPITGNVLLPTIKNLIN